MAPWCPRFFKKGGKKQKVVLVFATKRGDLSKTWNVHGYKVSKVSDTAGHAPPKLSFSLYVLIPEGDVRRVFQYTKC